MRAHVPIAHAMIGLPAPNGLDHTIFLDPANFAEEDKRLAFRVLLVSHQMIKERRSWIAITADGYPVRDQGEDVIQLVRHPAKFRHVTDGTKPIQFGRDDILKERRLTPSQDSRAKKKNITL